MTAAKQLAAAASRNEAEAWLEELKLHRDGKTLWTLEELYQRFQTADVRHQRYTRKALALKLPDYMYQPLGPDVKIKNVWILKFKGKEAQPTPEEFHVWAFKPEHGGPEEYRTFNSTRLREIYCKEHNLPFNKREAVAQVHKIMKDRLAKGSTAAYVQ